MVNTLVYKMLTNRIHALKSAAGDNPDTDSR